jgi:hypothetical protein
MNATCPAHLSSWKEKEKAGMKGEGRKKQTRKQV